MAGDFPRRPLRPLTIACAALALLGALVCFCAGTPRATAAIGPSQPGIVDGAKTTIAQWPWQTALMLRGKKVAKLGGLRRQFCAGSLVAPRVVITAGHCVIDRSFRRNHTFSVVSGRTTLSTDEGVESRVAATWVPSDPDGTVLYGDSAGNTWDVAVLQLAQPATGTPIKLAGPGEAAAWDAGSPVFATGWGDIATSGRPSDQLRVAQLAIDADSTCSAQSSYGSEFDPTLMLCASAPGRDTCQGDSGGPLVAPVGGGSYRLVGDTSFGRECAAPNFPGIYGRIAGDPMRTVLEQGVRELTGAGIVAGSTTPAFPQLSVAAAQAKAQAYAEKQCSGSFCRRAEVTSCTPAGTSFICAIADRYKNGAYGKSSAKKELLIVSDGGAARILMVTGMRYPKGWG